MKKICTLLFLIMCFVKTNAQDIHYSQYYNAAFIMQAGQAGMINGGDYRLGMQMRNQWQALPVPYNSSAVYGDGNFNVLKQQLGAGFVMQYDRSGDGQLSAGQFYLPLSKRLYSSADSVHRFQLGLMPGIQTFSINYSRLSFDQQYQNGLYDASSGNGESFGGNRFSMFDVGSGISYLYRKSERTSFQSGFSVFHLTAPQQSFFRERNLKMDRKLLLTGLAQFKIAPKADLLAGAMTSFQGKYKEILFSLTGKYYLRPTDGKTTALYAGLIWRNKDAAAFSIAMDYLNFHTELSYDLNYSSLKTASGARGGTELSIIYIFRKEKPFSVRKKVCPIYL